MKNSESGYYQYACFFRFNCSSDKEIYIKIKSLSWHDGILNGYTFEANYGLESKLTINLELYPEQIISSERKPIQIVCTNLEWYKADVNMSDLLENRTAGNINHGEMIDTLLRIELFGGDILVKAKHYIVKKYSKL